MRSPKRYLFILTLPLLALLFNLQLTPALAAATLLVDFEGGLPDGWFAYSGAGASVTADTLIVADTHPLARPGQAGDNTILESTFDASSGFGGFGQDFAVTTGSQDWTTYTGVTFWFYGSNSGHSFQFEIFDNRSDPTIDTAERFDTLFSDNFSGWQQILIPFSDFTRATDFQPGGAPNDGLTLTEMWGWAVILDGAAGAIYVDDIGLEKAIVDDFESGLPVGADANGNQIGFFTFSDPNSTVAISTTDTPPAPVPGSSAANNVLQVDTNVNDSFGFAGVIHAFENQSLDTWAPQDWSSFTGFSFWLYGNNSGQILFVDILDNRVPGSTGDTAERYSVDIIDDFSGWRLFEIPFADFNRKEVGNGAPNDGFTLTEVHGWAFGVFNAGQAFTNYLDDIALFGAAELPELTVSFSANFYPVTEGNNATVTVKLSRPLDQEGDPAEVTVSYTTEDGSAIEDRDYTAAAGTLTFTAAGPTEQTFTISTLDDNKFEGGETVILRLSDPIGAPLGFVFQSRIDINDDEAFDPSLIDDFEDGIDLWHSSDNVILANPEIAAADPLALPEQGAYERILHVTAPLHVEIDVQGQLCNQGNGIVTIVLPTTAGFDAATVDHTTVTLGNAYETHINPQTGKPRRHEEDVDNDGDTDLVFHFRFTDTGLPCHPAVIPFNGWTFDSQPITAGGSNAHFGRNFALDEDWSASEGLTFWYYGQNSGDTITVELLDNRAPDPGPDGWSLTWSDEFNDAAGTPPNPANWSYEIGDGAVNGIPGWGNDELQYYTNNTDNAATDGQGNLLITAKEADGSLTCYYGPCEYTSARLISWHKAEFAYGRIEARIQVPFGDGLWPAFWSLGTDIDVVNWPQTGEIDIMEFVGREPYEVFGTIHGPGYSGGASYGDTYTFGVPVSEDFHTFAIEWQPDLIEWYVDDILYHTATPADVAPNEWVFNDPIFLIMNVAVGGNFGGPVGDDTIFPQTMTVDYVRVYQGPDTAERFEATFSDDFSGWQQLFVPFSSFNRSVEQPDGAPDDGLGLTEIWGYGFKLPDAGTMTGSLFLDQVRLAQPSAVTVMNSNDNGPGSLRQALNTVAPGGAITFDSSLAGDTINLTSGPLLLSKDVTIDGSDAPGLTLSGGDVDRVMIINPGATVTATNLVIADGWGWQVAGGILNNGTLTLDHVTVTNNTMATDAGDFWQGGGGIYSGEGATLNLIDSTVSNNTAAWSGGGVYSFFNTTTTIVRSTISGNLSNDVGGGIRLLSDAEISNSTISGNESTGWYGGALFLTDGVLNMTNSTVVNNVSPVFAPAVVFVGTFGDGAATLNLANSIVANNVTEGCFLAPFGAGAVAINSLGNNIFSDGTCFPVGSDQIVSTVNLGVLADNGGPTLTHALLAGSPAIDAANSALCPAIDQRGVGRPQGAGCDSGAFELQP